MSFHPLNGEEMESEMLGLRRVHLAPLDHLLTKNLLQAIECHVLCQMFQLISYQWASEVFMSCTGLFTESFALQSMLFPNSSLVTRRFLESPTFLSWYHLKKRKAIVELRRRYTEVVANCDLADILKDRSEMVGFYSMLC
jgi:hypothetical protein